MGEFDIIKQYFNKWVVRSDILQSIGDDCAVVKIKENQQLAITTDTLVCGTHFLSNISPSDLAYKAVAVNLSDLAAMGAKPSWISLALTLPKINHQWLNQFSNSLFDILNHYDITLIGGDTTKGHLSITITAQGILENVGLFRHNAKIGDYIYVSGYLGDSAAGLNLLLNEASLDTDDKQYLVRRHLRPTPRVELGQLLTQYSHCAIDISDGLLVDLAHILTRSQCGAEIYLEKLPLSSSLLNTFSIELAERFALTGGEDYELCFTISENMKEAFEEAIKNMNVPCHCIGKITQSTFILSKFREAVPFPIQNGFDHFNEYED